MKKKGTKWEGVEGGAAKGDSNFGSGKQGKVIEGEGDARQAHGNVGSGKQGKVIEGEGDARQAHGNVGSGKQGKVIEGEGDARQAHGNVGSGTYSPQYAQRSSPKYSPKKAVKSFRDLEVYQKMMECSVLISAELIPILEKEKFPLVEGMRNCALSVPLHIAEAHGMRFSNFDRAIMTLESAMQGCNKMIVYLEQVQGLSNNADDSFLEDMSSRYMQTRGKMLRLERAWQKFRATSGT